MSDLEHLPDRPAWDCKDCGQPWPCEPARERLIAETGGGTALAVLMLTYLGDFLSDVAEMAGVFDRFVGWTRGSST